MKKIRTKSFGLATIQAGDESAEKFALVVPGRLDTKDYAHMTAIVEHLESLGFFAVSFDPPGTWESEGSIDDYTMTNYLKAIDEVIEYFGNRPTLMVGHSRGGSVSTNAAARNKHITLLVTCMSRIQKQEDDMAWREQGYIDEYRDIPPGTERTPKEDLIHIELPYAFHADSLQYDSPEVLQSLNIPKLMFSGKQDVITPPELIEEAFAMAPEPKMFHAVDFGHDFRLSKEIIEDVKRKITEFLEKYPE